MKIVIKDADFEDFNELAKLARQGKINTFCMTDEDEERPQGEWKIGGETTHYYYCSICGKDGDLQDNFCRNCGADMRGAK